MHSAPFRIPSAGDHILWRLFWILDPHQGPGLYVECANLAAGPAGGWDVPARFLPLHANFALGVRARNAGAPALRNALVNLSHTFTRQHPDWGVQALLPPADDFFRPFPAEDLRVGVMLRLVLANAVPNPRSLRLRPEGPSIEATLISEEPRILMIDNFMTPPECEQLRALARPDLCRSRVSSGTETPSRTSHGTFLTGAKENDEIVLRIEERISRCVGNPAILKEGKHVRKALYKSEALQVVRYREGQFYNEHYDNKAGNAAHRAATFMVYLTDVEQGGATYFPRSTGRPVDAESFGLDLPSARGPKAVKMQFLRSGRPQPGLRIYPKCGRAILFWSRLYSGHEDSASIHAAEAVDGGEKWVLTRWLREMP